MDYHELLKQVPSRKRKVTLKTSKQKGVGIYALRTIEKGETIAYYRMKVFNLKEYDSPTNFVYAFEIYKKNGQEYKRLIGDLFEGSFPQPGKDGITFWAPFVNEPTIHQKSNADIDIASRYNYDEKNKTSTQAGDIVDYKLVATRTIRPKEEILWYYGDQYSRNYEAGKR